MSGRRNGKQHTAKLYRLKDLRKEALHLIEHHPGLTLEKGRTSGEVLARCEDEIERVTAHVARYHTATT